MLEKLPDVWETVSLITMALGLIVNGLLAVIKNHYIDSCISIYGQQGVCCRNGCTIIYAYIYEQYS